MASLRRKAPSYGTSAKMNTILWHLSDEDEDHFGSPYIDYDNYISIHMGFL